MTSRLLPVTLMIIATLCGTPVAGWPQAKSGSWLDDAKPGSWNKRGTAIPVAPKIQATVDPRCREAKRPPQLDEDKRVSSRGWDLVGAYQGGWGMLVVRGTAGYDGMCRPLQFQDFVFVKGVFAGTLSPRPMDSRTDGALNRVSLQGASRLTAEYARYDAKDPLCCPSRLTHVIFEIAADGVLRPASVNTAPTQSTSSTPSPGLAGTSWQLVKFQGGDDKTLTPDDRAKYTIEFMAGGQFAARIDCNRGSGTWTSSGPSQIQFGPMAVTRAQCPDPSLHDQILRQWGNITSYVVRNGHLFLALKADGGIYEFEPIAKRK